MVVRGQRLLVAGLLVLGLVAAQVLTRAGAPALAPLRALLVEAMAPAAGAVAAVAGAVRSAHASVAELMALRADNQRLQRELTHLEQDQVALQEAVQENARLRALLGLKGSLAALLPYPADAVAARVIARSPATWFDALVLDKGGADGVRVGMIVMAPQGLVGRVAAVTPHTASVRLLTDPDSAVGAMVQRASSRDAGVVLGVLGQGRLTMQFFTSDPAVAPGDTIITSGLGGVFPAGLPIGTVTAVSPARYGQVRTAEVTPLVDLDDLEDVLLIAPPPGG